MNVCRYKKKLERKQLTLRYKDIEYLIVSAILVIFIGDFEIL